MLRRVECLVVREELKFPIIGNHELSSLVIDPVSNLERLLASRSLPNADEDDDSNRPGSRKSYRSYKSSDYILTDTHI